MNLYISTYLLPLTLILEQAEVQLKAKTPIKKEKVVDMKGKNNSNK